MGHDHAVPTPARIAAAPASSTSPAPNVTAAASPASARPSRSPFPPASTTARPSPCGDRAMPGRTAAPPATCWSRSASAATRCSRGRGRMSTVRCPSRLRRLPAARRSRCRRSTARSVYDRRGHADRHAFRLKGKGIPYVNGRSRGDQYVTVVVETPTSPNALAELCGVAICKKLPCGRCNAAAFSGRKSMTLNGRSIPIPDPWSGNAV